MYAEIKQRYQQQYWLAVLVIMVDKLRLYHHHHHHHRRRRRRRRHHHHHHNNWLFPRFQAGGGHQGHPEHVQRSGNEVEGRCGAEEIDGGEQNQTGKRTAGNSVHVGLGFLTIYRLN